MYPPKDLGRINYERVFLRSLPDVFKCKNVSFLYLVALERFIVKFVLSYKEYNEFQKTIYSGRERMSKVWLLPLAVILLLYGIYHLRDDLHYRPKTVKRHKQKSSKKLASKTGKSSESVGSDKLDDKLGQSSEELIKTEKTWKERKAEKKTSRVKVIQSDEVRAEQEQVLAQLALRNSMHAEMTERYVKARVLKD